MPQPVRVRFAPSPTGLLHIGGVRSALYNWLFARGHDGTFLLRIEDTDRSRFVPEAQQQIEESLRWVGLQWDEEPYTQSERLDLYRQHADELLRQGALYQDYTSAERLGELRAEAQRQKRPFRFTKDLAQTKPEKPNDPHVLRFHIPEGSDVEWHDAVWGDQRWQRAVLDDFVAIKSDGFPTYQFANVVDDRVMQISHVIRAAEWIPSTPKHILLYRAFGWKPPIFAHLPQVLGPDKAKLSKRHGAKSVLEYRDAGYLPEAVMNFLALLGWNEGGGSTKELYTPEELIQAFSLERVQSSPAVFDSERLDWMNGLYIRQLPLEELAKRAEGFWPEPAKAYDSDYKNQVLGLIQERLKFLAEIPELTGFFFQNPDPDSKLLAKQVEKATAVKLLQRVGHELEGSSFEASDLEQRLRQLAEQEDVKPGQLFGLIRVAVTGQTAAPGLFETLHVLGQDVSLQRIKQAASLLA